MGRLSAYAKNRILKLRFKKNKRIIHIVDILKKDDNIKVSRQAVSTFLKKYLETNSIYDKPRTGRKRKLTQEEIQLIGQVTRLNRDITARAIKEYLNLNVSTYTILRATKLFEWNKINPNSNDSKKAAALERQLNVGGSETQLKTYGKKGKGKKSDKLDSSEANELSEGNTSGHIVSFEDSMTDLDKTDEFDKSGSFQSETETVDLKKLNEMKMNKMNMATIELESILQGAKIDLQLIAHRELLSLKNLSCSPMSFATKILFKIFKIDELHGHNVSGKTLNKNLKAKLPLDPVRIGYIKYLVDTYYDEKECKEMLSGVTSHKQDLWKSCHTAINKSILISERKAAAALANGTPLKQDLNTNLEGLSDESYMNIINFQNRNDSEFSGRLVPENDGEVEEDGDENDDDDECDSDSDDSDIELQPKIVKQKKNKNTVIMTHRSRHFSRRPKSKLGGDDQDMAEGSEDESFEMSEVKEEYETPNFEIELIQNIENRLVNKSNTSPPPPSMKSTPLMTRRSAALSNQQSTASSKLPISSRSKTLTPLSVQHQESTEASAAANIAASMKKRIVVIASSQKQDSRTV